MLFFAFAEFLFAAANGSDPYFPVVNVKVLPAWPRDWKVPPFARAALPPVAAAVLQPAEALEPPTCPLKEPVELARA